jgi:Cupin superfamily protein
VCVVRRRDPDYFAPLLRLADLDRVLSTHAPRHPEVSLVQANREIPASDYTSETGVLDPLRTSKLFAEGATIVYQQLHNRLPVLAEFCAALGQVFSSRMQTNIYLTPPGSQGFKPHWDTHDVFVLQVTGSKRWTIFDTKIPLPLRGQQFDPKRDTAGAPTDEFEVHAGDTVYIPRGVMHSARSTEELSLHVTTGLAAYTWADLLLQAVAAAALTDPALRENLPLGFARKDFALSERAGEVRERLARVSAFMEAESPFAYFAGELLARNRPCLVGILDQTARLSEIRLSSAMRRRPGTTYDLQVGDKACVLLCHGNRIELPAFLAPALEFVLTRPRFRVRQVPDCVDDPGKLTLVRRLVKEGLLEGLDLGG